jgi:hypothetical protein
MDLELVNDGELHHLCSTLRFWAVEMPPNALIEYCYTMFSLELQEVAEEYGHALPYLNILAAIRKCKTADGRLCTALRFRNLPLLKYVLAIAKSTGSLCGRSVTSSWPWRQVIMSVLLLSSRKGVRRSYVLTT